MVKAHISSGGGLLVEYMPRGSTKRVRKEEVSLDRILQASVRLPAGPPDAQDGQPRFPLGKGSRSRQERTFEVVVLRSQAANAPVRVDVPATPRSEAAMAADLRAAVEETRAVPSDESTDTLIFEAELHEAAVAWVERINDLAQRTRLGVVRQQTFPGLSHDHSFHARQAAVVSFGQRSASRRASQANRVRL